MVSLIVSVMTAWCVQRIDTHHLQFFGYKVFFPFCCVFLFSLGHGFYRLHQDCQSLLGCTRWPMAVGGFVCVRPCNCSKVKCHVGESWSHNYLKQVCRRNGCEDGSQVEDEANECVFAGEVKCFEPNIFLWRITDGWNSLCCRSKYQSEH